MGCKLPRVGNFLFCMSLETGGLVIGYLAAIGAILATALGIGMIVLSYFALDSIEDADPDAKQLAFIILTVVFSIVILYSLFVAFAAVQLIRGTKNRNHVQMKLYMVLMAIGVVISFLNIINSSVAAIVTGIISAIIHVYFFICIYSLYYKFKEERMQPTNPHPYPYGIQQPTFVASPPQYGQPQPSYANPQPYQTKSNI